MRPGWPSLKMIDADRAGRLGVRALSAKVQVPRWISAMLPAGEAGEVGRLQPEVDDGSGVGGVMDGPDQARSGPSVGVGPDGPDRVGPGHPLGMAAQAVLGNGGAGGMVEVCGAVCSDGIRIQSSG